MINKNEIEEIVYFINGKKEKIFNEVSLIKVVKSNIYEILLINKENEIYQVCLEYFLNEKEKIYKISKVKEKIKLISQEDIEEYKDIKYNKELDLRNNVRIIGLRDISLEKLEEINDRVNFAYKGIVMPKLYGNKLVDISFIKNQEEKNTYNKDELELVKEAKTLHSYGYYDFFKPSIEEIVCSLTDENLEGICLIDLVDYTKESKIEFNLGFHVGKVKLYKNK